MADSSPITTHVLDTARGKPASGIRVSLQVESNGGWREIGRGVTNQDGRINDLLGEAKVQRGKYRLTFETGEYLAESGNCFFPEVDIVFQIHDSAQHFHVPLLLSPYGYSTYRGS